jgi:hypothetical protein
LRQKKRVVEKEGIGRVVLKMNSETERRKECRKIKGKLEKEKVKILKKQNGQRRRKIQRQQKKRNDACVDR